MKTIGLDDRTLQTLRRIFSNYPGIQQVKLYGSRAKGTNHERSDIDLAVLGENVDRFMIADILLTLDDSDIPFLIDLQNYHDIKNRQLIEHIDRVGLVIYDRDQAVKGRSSLRLY
ncbi:nucleotidyltransferase domain-containing protein [methane-oxidizing endosymbiont of Gigantopelta aegis]|uniref:nucleotidyltransferase domain-containing protein n=1 Tax=methane-oxidizing endosymbiont of Gigantopelta aegis TaxID=2794938 RepID=UPI0018DC76EA|nr:nucleotidyltransferase domain-containing protein [methane-oxidizing endosymbiont of Gigantopelta aegis]